MTKTAPKSKAAKPAASKTTAEAAHDAAAVAAPIFALRLRHEQIAPDATQDRRTFDAAELAQLADSMAGSGLQQPPKVTPAGADGLHTIVMGERRWRAWGLLIADGRWPADHAQLCALETGDELARRKAALVENACRVDLNHMEYARAFERLGADHGLTNRQIATDIGRTIEFVQQHRFLLKLSAKDQLAVEEGRLPFQQALQLLRSSIAALDPVLRLALAEVAHKVITAHGKLEDYKRVEISPVTPAVAIEALAPFLQFSLENHNDGRASASLYYGSTEKLKKGLPGLFGADPDASLRELRMGAIAHGEDGLKVVTDLEGYGTAWLNGPWELPPEAAAKMADRARQEEIDRADREIRDKVWQERRDADNQARAERAAQLRAAVDGWEARLREPPTAAPLAEAVTARANEVEHPLPWHWDPIAKCISDANGMEVELATWGDQSEPVDRLVIGAVNAAAGLATPEPKHIEPPEEADEDESGVVGLDDPSCRICGCTEDHACETDEGPCSWAEADLCSNLDCLAAAAAEISGDAAAADEEPAPVEGVRTGPLAGMLSDTFAQQIREASAEEV